MEYPLLERYMILSVSGVTSGVYNLARFDSCPFLCMLGTKADRMEFVFSSQDTSP